MKYTVLSVIFTFETHVENIFILNFLIDVLFILDIKFKLFFSLQVSQYTFAMCSYREKKSEPTEMMQLDGYTVDYVEPVLGIVCVFVKVVYVSTFGFSIASLFEFVIFFFYK